MANKPWTDADRLRRMYVEEGMSSREIASELDCGKKTILRWLDRHGIEKRGTSEATSLAMQKNHCGFHTTKKGYEYASTRHHGRSWQVGIHRLMAVANGADPHVVFSGDGSTHTHHKNGVPWDNRPENIEVLSKSEHQKEHMDDFTRDKNGRIDGVDRS